MALSGVPSSWLLGYRNSVLAWLVASASRRADCASAARGQQGAGLVQPLRDLAELVAGAQLRRQRQAFAQAIGVGRQHAQPPRQRGG